MNKYKGPPTPGDNEYQYDLPFPINLEKGNPAGEGNTDTGSPNKKPRWRCQACGKEEHLLFNLVVALKEGTV